MKAILCSTLLFFGLFACAPKTVPIASVEQVPTETILQAICRIEDRRHENGESSDYYRNEHMDAYREGTRSPQALLAFLGEASLACRGALIQLMAISHPNYLKQEWRAISETLSDDDKFALIRGISVHELVGFDDLIFDLISPRHSPAVREKAGSLLAMVNQEERFQDIAHALKSDPDPNALSSMLLAVDIDKTPQLLPQLESLFQNPDEEVHLVIMNNVGMADFAGKKEFLKKYLSHPNEAVRKGAASRLESLRHKEKLEKSVTVSVLDKQVHENLLDDDLLNAVKARDSARVKLLLADGANPNGVDESGRPLISIATRWGYTWLVREALAMGADPNLKDNGGQTAMHIACMVGYPEIVNVLMLHGGDVHLPDNEGQTPAHLAQLLEQEMVLKRLKAGPSVPGGDSELLKAVWAGDLETVSSLIEAGADIEERDQDGNTALILAAKGGYNHIIQYLAEKGAHLRTRNFYKMTAKTVAYVEGQKPSSDLLLKLLEQEHHDLSLLAAVEKGDLEEVGVFLKKGASLKAVDASGRNALVIAVSQGSTDMVKLLLEKGLDPSSSVWQEMDALEYARSIGQEAVAAVLEDHGH